MKQLKRIRLINWHRFTNETIELADACLLSGENGAGKSTILDAIQLVITASKNNFNKAAHEKGKRTLNTYIRCKTGQEGKPYERTGELSAHVALEFFDESKNIPFIMGCVMDSASEEREPNTAWYLIERKTMEDEMFFHGKQVRSISSFRSANGKILKNFATTQKQAQAMVLQRFGRLEDKFFTLIPKALAFKPISDIKDFVYSYVLDEKDVNIDALRENVRSYQDLSRTLEDVKKRIRELEAISARYEQIKNCMRIDQYQEYYLVRCEEDMLEEEIHALDEKIRSEMLRQEDFERRKEEIAGKIRVQEEMIMSLSVELASNTEYQAYLELEKKKAELQSRMEQDEKAVRELMRKVRMAGKAAKGLIDQENVTGPLDECIGQYLDALTNVQQLENLMDLRDLLERVLASKKNLYGTLQEQMAALRFQIHGMVEKKSGLSAQIHELEQRRLQYKPEVLRLMREISAQLQKDGRAGDVRILCEQLEVTDPSWQDAVEGYLNSQRFYLLVSPENFDLSASVYDRLRREKKAYGAGLINTGKLERYDEAPEGSLAGKVSSKNPYARRYANMVLGRVHCCQKVEELRQYEISMTKSCMRYQNHVVSAIRPEIFNTPYIGAKAYEIQLKARKEELEKLQKELLEAKNREKCLELAVNMLDTSVDVEVKYQLGSLERQRADEAALAKIQSDLKAISADKTFLEKQLHLQELQTEKKRLDIQRDELSQCIGACRQAVSAAEEQIENRKEQWSVKSKEAEKLLNLVGEAKEGIETDYQKEKSRRASLAAFHNGFEASRKANATRKEQFQREMEELMHGYKVAYDFGGAANFEGFDSFRKEYVRLRDSKLLDYEEQVQKARESAEEEFREQFLSKLQENIKQAQSEFRELNRALREIHFAHERYEFLYAPKAAEQKYYSMIMDDFNVMQGESIFSGAFNSNHKEVIEELFEKLALDDENSQEALEQYTDYRFYMDYDIKITGDDGSYMYYSKVAREKSGGETQTPFYITVAASFMQLYRSSIGGDSVGLIMMDEAFNNMDDERIQGVLSFMRSADLQLIISAPPEKIQYIGPAMDKVLLVLTDGHQSYVEDFTHEKV